MNKLERASILVIAIGNIFLSKPFYSIGIGTLIITMILIAIYEEVKKLNEDDYRE